MCPLSTRPTSKLKSVQGIATFKHHIETTREFFIDDSMNADNLEAPKLQVPATFINQTASPLIH